MKSKYLDRFNKLATAMADTYELRGNLILVEKLPEEEKITKSGLILPTEDVSARQHSGMSPDKKLLIVRVLVCGKGYYDEEDETKTIPLDMQPGNLVSVPPTAVQWYSMFERMDDYEQYTIGRIVEGDVQAVWRDEEAYEKYFEILNG